MASLFVTVEKIEYDSPDLPEKALFCNRLRSGKLSYDNTAHTAIINIVKLTTLTMETTNRETELLDGIAAAINNFGFDKNAFARHIATLHPTIQQRFFALVKQCVFFMAAEGNVNIDDRNRHAYELCRKLEPLVKDAYLPLI